ncbi:hypothetical protein [Herbaspirillum huttiense]|uniref:hypothetical protein n=1 Tax=Herbaspirillum huttiense TaxID=863372 RepID=UPI0039AFF946
MTAKTSGAEFKQFYNDKAFWPEDAWHEDSVILVDGKPHEDLSDSQIADSAKVVIDSGHVFFSREDSAGVSMVTFFNRWRKVQNMPRRRAAKSSDLCAMNDSGIDFEMPASPAANWSNMPGVRPPPPVGIAVAAQLLAELQELG